MKFLQTSDWHLGKEFYEYPLLSDQQHFLNQIICVLEEAEKNQQGYDALVVPGDIYDRAVPPGDAVTLFSRFLYEIHSKFPRLKLFFLSGNHDSASRLSFAAELLQDNNIHICTKTDEEHFTKPVITGRKGSEAAVYQLPFLFPGSISSGDPEKVLRTQQELYERAVSLIQKAHKKDYPELPAVICAHLFTAGSVAGDSERSYVGTAEQVSSSVFDFFAYAAIGHIHKAQSFSGGKVRYSGAPLSYTFGEKDEKLMLSVTVEGSELSVTEIPFKPLHPVVRLTGTFDEFYALVKEGSVCEELKNSFVEIQCTDSLPHENAIQLLRTGFPLILSFTRKSQENDLAEESTIAERKALLASGAKDSGAVFDLFLKDVSAADVKALSEQEQKLVQREKEIFIEFLKTPEAEK